MHRFEVGKPYPLHNHTNGQERALLQRTDSFFDVLYYSPAAKDDAPTWRTGALRYGLAEPSPGLPFVLFELPGEWQFDVTLNLRKANTTAQADAWIQSPANTVVLYLIHARTNVLHGMRIISVPEAWAAELRAAAGRQLARYAEAEAIDRAIAGQETVALDLLIRTTRMLRAGQL